MTKLFNPYSFAITATKKAIKDRKSKLAEQEKIEAMSMDDQQLGQLAFNIGRAEAECEHYQGTKKKAAEKKLAQLLETRKKIDSAYSPQATELMFKREDEIAELEKALRELERLSNRFEERSRFLTR